MLRIFGHYISLRALSFAAFEVLAFVGIYNIARAFVLHSALPVAANTHGYFFLLPLCSFIALATASGCGLYNKEMCADSHGLVPRLLTASVLMYFLMALTILFASLVFSDTGHIHLYYAITLTSAIGYFTVALLFRHNVFKLDFNNTPLARRILVVGIDDCADCTAKLDYLGRASRSPYTAVGFVPVQHKARSTHPTSLKEIPGDVLATSTGLRDRAHQLGVDEIVVASRERRGIPTEALMECRLAGIAVTELSSFWERQTGQIDLDDLNPNWLIFSDGFRTSWLLQLTKRAFDIAVALLLLIVTLPITVIAAIAVWIDSPGGLFYRQDRVGKGGAVFSIFKFRSMRSDAEKDGIARWAQNNDCRVTRVGRFLRRTRIDEIPQVLNVLLGTMSFVGPRPERPVFVDALSRKIPHYDARHCIKPGITGWAQINYPYGASDEDARAKLAYDLYYAKNWGIFLDSVILLQTAAVVLWPNGVR
ncbi:MAG: TIGR03013 family XrtA/PEP-CTERM system glycosyltransferase [Rhodospirillaceae bacterium]